MGWWAPSDGHTATVAVDMPANIPRPGYFAPPAGRGAGGAR